jgi:hypothetical protein
VTTCPFCGSCLAVNWMDHAFHFKCETQVKSSDVNRNNQSITCTRRERDKLRQELDKARAELQHAMTYQDKCFELRELCNVATERAERFERWLTEARAEIQRMKGETP